MEPLLTASRPRVRSGCPCDPRTTRAALLIAILISLLVSSAHAQRGFRPRIDAVVFVPDRPLVIPIASETGAVPRLRRGDVVAGQRPLRARVRWIARAVRQDRPSALAVWLELHSRWRVAEAPSTGEGFYALVVDAPDDPTSEIRVAGRTVRLVRPSPAAPVRPLDEDRDLVAALEAELRDPFWRWHAILGLERLGRTPTPTPQEDPILEAWAAQETDAWREGLRRLAQADPGLSARLQRRLWLTARFGGSARWPVWPASPTDLADLRDALLAPARMVDRVRAWLDDQTRVLTWVDETRSDDGMPILGALNLDDEPRVLWVRSQPPVPHELPPLESVRIPLAGQAPWTIATPDGEFRLADPARAIPLHPPGLVMAPLLGDWTLRSLLLASPRRDEGTAGLFFLQRGDDLVPEDPGVIRRFDAPPRPTLYFERRESMREARLWLGPQRAPDAIVRITGEGQVRDERTRTPIDGARTIVDPDRLVSLIPLPAHLVNAGELLIGLEVIDTGGMRWSWPAARMPWQTQPARSTVDVRTWDGFRR